MYVCREILALFIDGYLILSPFKYIYVANVLTYCGFFMVSNILVHTGSGNDLSLVPHQAINCTNVDFCILDPQEKISVRFQSKYF